MWGVAIVTGGRDGCPHEILTMNDPLTPSQKRTAIPAVNITPFHVDISKNKYTFQFYRMWFACCIQVSCGFRSLFLICFLYPYSFFYLVLLFHRVYRTMHKSAFPTATTTQILTPYCQQVQNLHRWKPMLVAHL